MNSSKKSFLRRLLESFARARTRRAQHQVEAHCSAYCLGDRPDERVEDAFISR